MEGNFYKNILNDFGISMLIPNNVERDQIHHKIISELVLNDFRADTKMQFTHIIERLASMGSQEVILGCTEIPLLMKASEVSGIRLFSTTEICCRAIVGTVLT
jgi:aspartate racemase